MDLIRPAEQSDASAIAHVHIESWLTTYDGIVPAAYLANLSVEERTLSWQQWLTLDVHVFVAECDGAVVGFSSGGPIRDAFEGYDAELFAIYLLRAAQGRGLGTRLLQRLSESLRLQGSKRLIAWVLEQNPAVHFYQKSAAVIVGEKQVEIGGTVLNELAMGWTALPV